MKKSDAEKEIKIIWHGLPKDKSLGGSMSKKNPSFGFAFYCYLKKNRPDLLDFQHDGDTYQVINGWVGKWQTIDRRA